MQSRNVISCAVCLLVVHLAVAYAANNATSTNTTLVISVVQTTTTPAAPSTTVKTSNATSTDQKVKNATGKPGKDEDDCSDEEPAAEPEGTTVAGDRQGKQLHLNDKDKYTHDGGKAEPEPESEPNSNSTSSTGKLTGNSTTARPAVGAATTISESTFGLGVLAATTAIYLRAASSSL